MPKAVGIGLQDFKKIRDLDTFYIDKTKFIPEWWNSKDEVTLITRPRRFGKTLMMSTVENFFSVERADGSLFESLEVWNNPEYRTLQGTYPVIMLSFSDIKENSYQEVRNKICESIVDLYNHFDFLARGELLNEREKEYFYKVFSALEEYGMPDQKQEVKNWYDGFTFGSMTDIYNPWSIINFLDTGRFQTYWANTSSNHLADELIQRGSKDIKTDFENLLRGKAIETQLDEQIIYDQLAERESAVWSLFLASGYLKVVKTEFLMRTGRTIYSLSLTNREVRIMFENMIHGWFADYDSGYNDFVRALLQEDLRAMNVYMNRVALTTFSFFDTGRKPSRETEPERLLAVKATAKSLKGPNSSVCFYHGFVLGLIVELEGRYSITSNRESGFGRYDVILEPYDRKDNAYIMEFKVRDPEDEKDLSATVQSALRQIDDKKYDTVLAKKGFPADKIRKYGFAFQGKEVLIGRCAEEK